MWVCVFWTNSNICRTYIVRECVPVLCPVELTSPWRRTKADTYSRCLRARFAAHLCHCVGGYVRLEGGGSQVSVYCVCVLFCWLGRAEVTSKYKYSIPLRCTGGRERVAELYASSEYEFGPLDTSRQRAKDVISALARSHPSKNVREHLLRTW